MSGDHARRVYDSILELLPDADNPTPMVRLRRVIPFAATTVYAKLEWYNPFGAVKDRIAANLVRDAEQRQTLGPGRRLVEPTSGNTGLGLAMIGNAKGYPLRAPLSRMIPIEKRAALRFFGCDLIELDDTLCPAPGAPEGAIARAMEIADSEPDYVLLNQYANDANPEAHYRTTGPEIWRQTGGRVTHVVASLGTCGTVTGTGRYLKEQNPGIRLIAVHPEEGHDIPGVRSIRQLSQTRFFNPDDYDHLVEVSNREAYDMTLRLNREESLIAGPSSGMAVCGLLKVLEDRPDAVVVVMFADNVFKYSSSIQRHFPQFFPQEPAAAAGRESGVERLVALARNPHNTAEVEEVRSLSERGETRLIDVRGPEEYRAGHVPGAVNIPLAELDQAGD
ncbi:MAG: pyridoxal-phosphate dependent enzyme, partial [Halofilum sp. (in: g-proteobacteria)]|nr:pyridoxal-phosphate dependent enzyme [Halofilum sp. (in: g-proteobacteria)]